LQRSRRLGSRLAAGWGRLLTRARLITRACRLQALEAAAAQLQQLEVEHWALQQAAERAAQLQAENEELRGRAEQLESASQEQARLQAQLARLQAGSAGMAAKVRRRPCLLRCRAPGCAALGL
jgi:uncharacterized protein (DUF3084 family)